MSLWPRLSALLLVGALFAVGAAAADERLPPAWAPVLAAAATRPDPGERAVQISAAFLGTPYLADTLGGGPDRPEQLTVRLDAVDCFTFLDYVEALRRSATADEFPAQLRAVRYRDGVVAWDRRRHFFTDWAAVPGGAVIDVTAAIGGSRALQVHKQLNRKADGSLHLPGVAVQERTLHYLPASAFDPATFGRLRSGDYLGIYTPAAGLDVSHVGLVVRQGRQLSLRHASSRPNAGRVIDSALPAYLAGKPGLIVFRPVAP